MFVLSPLPAVCMVCVTGGCPSAAEVTTSYHAMERSAAQGEDHCQLASNPSAVSRLALVAPDCCGSEPEAAATTPGISAPAPASLALTALAQDATPNLPPALSAEDRRNDAPPPEGPIPLYTLHSSLLI